MYNMDKVTEILVGLKDHLNDLVANKAEIIRDYEADRNGTMPPSYWVELGLKIAYEMSAILAMSALQDVQTKAKVL